jgi:3,4-dihydroxy-2-butanone 4-phosphate synthase
VRLVSTGISAHDRAATIHHLIDPDAKPSDFAKPGHTFPLRAVDGSVLKRTSNAGRTGARRRSHEIGDKRGKRPRLVLG